MSRTKKGKKKEAEVTSTATATKKASGAAGSAAASEPPPAASAAALVAAATSSTADTRNVFEEALADIARTLFSDLDADGGGTISTKEACARFFDPEQWEYILEAADENEDGEVSVDEWVAYALEQGREEGVSEATALFKSMHESLSTQETTAAALKAVAKGSARTFKRHSSRSYLEPLGLVQYVSKLDGAGLFEPSSLHGHSRGELVDTLGMAPDHAVTLHAHIAEHRHRSSLAGDVTTTTVDAAAAVDEEAAAAEVAAFFAAEAAKEKHMSPTERRQSIAELKEAAPVEAAAATISSTESMSTSESATARHAAVAALAVAKIEEAEADKARQRRGSTTTLRLYNELGNQRAEHDVMVAEFEAERTKNADLIARYKALARGAAAEEELVLELAAETRRADAAEERCSALEAIAVTKERKFVDELANLQGAVEAAKDGGVESAAKLAAMLADERATHAERAAEAVLATAERHAEELAELRATHELALARRTVELETRRVAHESAVNAQAAAHAEEVLVVRKAHSDEEARVRDARTKHAESSAGLRAQLKALADAHATKETGWQSQQRALTAAHAAAERQWSATESAAAAVAASADATGDDALRDALRTNMRAQVERHAAAEAEWTREREAVAAAHRASLQSEVASMAAAHEEATSKQERRHARALKAESAAQEARQTVLRALAETAVESHTAVVADHHERRQCYADEALATHAVAKKAWEAEHAAALAEHRAATESLVKTHTFTLEEQASHHGMVVEAQATRAAAERKVALAALRAEHARYVADFEERALLAPDGRAALEAAAEARHLDIVAEHTRALEEHEVASRGSALALAAAREREDAVALELAEARVTHTDVLRAARQEHAAAVRAAREVHAEELRVSLAAAREGRALAPSDSIAAPEARRAATQAKFFASTAAALERAEQAAAHDTSLRDASARAAGVLDARVAEAARSEAELVQQHAREVVKLRAEHAARVGALESEHTDAAALADTVRASQELFHARELKEATASAHDAFQRERATHAETLAELEQVHRARVDEMQTATRKKVAEHAATLRELTTGGAKDTESDRIGRLRVAAADATAEHEARLRYAQRVETQRKGHAESHPDVLKARRENEAFVALKMLYAETEARNAALVVREQQERARADTTSAAVQQLDARLAESEATNTALATIARAEIAERSAQSGETAGSWVGAEGAATMQVSQAQYRALQERIMQSAREAAALRHELERYQGIVPELQRAAAHARNAAAEANACRAVEVARARSAARALLVSSEVAASSPAVAPASPHVMPPHMARTRSPACAPASAQRAEGDARAMAAQQEAIDALGREAVGALARRAATRASTQRVLSGARQIAEERVAVQERAAARERGLRSPPASDAAREQARQFYRDVVGSAARSPAAKAAAVRGGSPSPMSVHVSRRGSVTISQNALAPRSGSGGYASPPARYAPGYNSPGYNSPGAYGGSGSAGRRSQGASGLSPRSQQALTKEIMEVHGAVNAMAARPPLALFRSK